MTGAGPELLVLLGTDHHRFDRLVGWVDDFLGQYEDGAVPALVQLGPTAPPRHAVGVGILPYAELQGLMRQASVVVTHGGPATIAEVRRQGRRPVVVPRDPARDEHVDSHQQDFSRRMAGLGLIALCEEQADFHQVVKNALADPAAFAVREEENRRDLARVAAAVAATGEIIDNLATRRPRRRRWAS